MIAAISRTVELIIAVLVAFLVITLLFILGHVQDTYSFRKSIFFTSFYHYKKIDDAGTIEYYKRTIFEDAIVTCYWVKDPKDRLLFHSCDHRTKHDL